MREKKSFAERAKVLTSDEGKKKYYLVYEGERTESLYFDAVNELKEEIRINPLIELIPIVRSYSEEGWSNPRKILERIVQNIEEFQSGNISYETLLNWIMEYFQDQGYMANNRPLKKSMWNTLIWICQEQLGVTLDKISGDPEGDCAKIVSSLKKETELENLMKDVTKIIKYGKITFVEGFDKICFIVDRDKESFTASQYEYVLEQCRKRGFGFYVTNPCFEFWLLLHFNDVVEINKEKLLENPKVTAKQRYSERELRKRIPAYRKSKYDAKLLVKNIDSAIHNEAKFCEDIVQLKEDAGSNIGLLICEMRTGSPEK